MSVSTPIQISESALFDKETDLLPEQTPARKRHINWMLKAILPIAAVLLNGLPFVCPGLPIAGGRPAAHCHYHRGCGSIFSSALP